MASLIGLRDRIKKASLVGAFFVAGLCANAVIACPLPGSPEVVRVRTVVDGDTVWLRDGRKVRLIGLNAPELAHEGRRAEPFAEAARARLEGLVRDAGGRLQMVVGQDAHDHYGRLLAHLADDRGRDLEAILLEEGLGYFIAISPNVALVDCLAAAERRARADRRGLWREPPVQAAAALRKPGFAVIEARVRSVDENHGGVWLETGGALVVHIPVRALSAFDRNGLRALSGQRIEVRGWVVERRGEHARARWLLPVSHPSMIRLPDA